MTNYLGELKQTQQLFRSRRYESTVRECGRIIELGMKEMYHRLEMHLAEKASETEWTAMHERFAMAAKDPFDSKKAGLGGLLLFARHTNFWEQLKALCESNLSFIKMINWGRVSQLRNKSIHEKTGYGDKEAMEMLFYTKVFLYDCGLIESPANPMPELLSAHCINCNYNVNESWNYCPQCSSPLHQHCSHCNNLLKPSHRICPSCDTPRACLAEQSVAENQYKNYAEAVWADWEVTPTEKRWLAEQRLNLGLSPAEAERIETSVIPKNYYHFLNLVDAVNIDGIIDANERQFLLEKAVEMKVPEEAARKIIGNTAKDNKKIRKTLLNMAFGF